MPGEVEQNALTAELEAELAKLTDELESECARLEAEEDRPLAAATPDFGAPEGGEDTPPPKPAAEPAPGRAAPGDPGAEDVAGLDEAIGKLLDDEAMAAPPSDGWREPESLRAPPIDLGAERAADAPAREDEPGAADREPGGVEVADAEAHIESIDRSLATLTAQLMEEGGERPAQEDATAPLGAPGDADRSTARTPAPEPAGAARSARERAGELTSQAARKVGPAARATAKATAVAARHTVRVAGPPAKAAGARAARAAAPLGATLLILASKPLETRSEAVRSSVGWLALGTLFIAVVTWFFVLVRAPAAPVAAETPATIRAAAQDPGVASASDAGP